MHWLEVPQITSGAHFAGRKFAGTSPVPSHNGYSQENTDVPFIFKNKIGKNQMTDPTVNKNNLTFHLIF